MFDSTLADVAERPPGPELAGVLAGVDLAALNGHQLVDVLVAQARQVAHDQARLLALMVEIAHCPPGGADAPAQRVDTVDEFAVDEIRAALRWTRRAAQGQLSLAYHLVKRLPTVYAALLAGAIDLPRARVLVDETLVLDDEQATAVVAEILPVAGRLTTGQLRDRLRRAVLTVDPDAAAKRQHRSMADRRVTGELDPDGTATLAGYQLPPDRAAAALARVTALANAARHDSDGRSLDQARADTFLDLLLGEHLPTTTNQAESDQAESDQAHNDQAHDDAASSGAGDRPPDGPTSPGRRPGGVQLQVPLTTLLGLSDEPGELTGWGPVIAEIARKIAADQPDTPWTCSIYDANGHLLHHIPIRRRPTTHQTRHITARDRTCRAPGCRAPATTADLDHTHDWATGGPTTEANLGCLCRHDHRLKHHGGWRLRQIRPGFFIWTSRLGHHYIVPPPDPPMRC